MKKLILKISAFIIMIFLVDTLLSSLLFKGLNEFTDFDLDVDTLFVGHSHTVYAIDSNLFEQNFGGTATKLALHGIKLSDRYALVKYYYNNTPSKPGIVIFDIDENILSKPEQNTNSHTRFYPFIADPDIERHISENGESSESILARKFLKTLRYNNSWILIRSLKGLFGFKDDKPPKKSINLDNYKNRPNRKIDFDSASEKIFLQIIDYLSKQNATVILAYYPKLFLNSSDQINYEKAISRISTIASNYRTVHLLDYNRDYKDSPQIFFDPTHVNLKGQELISLRIAKDLRALHLIAGRASETGAFPATFNPPAHD